MVVAKAVLGCGNHLGTAFGRGRFCSVGSGCEAEDKWHRGGVVVGAEQARAQGRTSSRHHSQLLVELIGILNHEARREN